eukprot:gene9021-18680_t
MIKVGSHVFRELDDTLYAALISSYDEIGKRYTICYIDDGKIETDIDISELRYKDENMVMTYSLADEDSKPVNLMVNREMEMNLEALHPTHIEYRDLKSIDDIASHSYNSKRTMRRVKSMEAIHLKPWNICTYNSLGKPRTDDVNLTPLAGRCSHCSTLSVFRCQRCSMSFFCSRRCQRFNWRSHQFVCKPRPFIPRYPHPVLVCSSDDSTTVSDKKARVRFTSSSPSDATAKRYGQCLIDVNTNPSFSHTYNATSCDKAQVLVPVPFMSNGGDDGDKYAVNGNGTTDVANHSTADIYTNGDTDTQKKQQQPLLRRRAMTQSSTVGDGGVLMSQSTPNLMTVSTDSDSQQTSTFLDPHTVDALMAMLGTTDDCDREQVRAVLLAYGDVNRAAEWFLSGGNTPLPPPPPPPLLSQLSDRQTSTVGLEGVSKAVSRKAAKYAAQNQVREEKVTVFQSLATAFDAFKGVVVGEGNGWDIDPSGEVVLCNTPPSPSKENSHDLDRRDRLTPVSEDDDLLHRKFPVRTTTGTGTATTMATASGGEKTLIIDTTTLSNEDESSLRQESMVLLDKDCYMCNRYLSVKVSQVSVTDYTTAIALTPKRPPPPPDGADPETADANGTNGGTHVITISSGDLLGLFRIHMEGGAVLLKEECGQQRAERLLDMVECHESKGAKDGSVFVQYSVVGKRGTVYGQSKMECIIRASSEVEQNGHGNGNGGHGERGFEHGNDNNGYASAAAISVDVEELDEDRHVAQAITLSEMLSVEFDRVLGVLNAFDGDMERAADWLLTADPLTPVPYPSTRRSVVPFYGPVNANSARSNTYNNSMSNIDD